MFFVAAVCYRVNFLGNIVWMIVNYKVSRAKERDKRKFHCLTTIATKNGKIFTLMRIQNFVG